MVSAWWLLGSFFLGTIAGIILIALCSANNN